jgi:tetratricopeptide (TPR) repeat protein
VQVSSEEGRHLNKEEISWLADEDPPVPEHELVRARQHAEECNVCGSQVRTQRLVHVNLRSLSIPVASERTSDCPSEHKWLSLAAGIYSEEVAPLLAHAADCDYCGGLLREVTDSLGSEPLAQEKSLVRQLVSSRPEWQRGLAEQLARWPKSTDADNDKKMLFSVPTRLRVFKLRNSWILGAAAVLLLGAGIGLWLGYSEPSLSATNQLISAAYTERRPFEPRFPGAGIGPLRQQRGLQQQRESPQSLKEAKAIVARRLTRNPKNPGWLQAKARIDLLDGNYQSAIDGLLVTSMARPDDVSMMVDLATAYFERAETSGTSADLDLAIQSLNRALAKSPNDSVALFNRALVYEREQKYSEALADWDRYLQLNSADGWTAEARKRQEDVSRLQR